MKVLVKDPSICIACHACESACSKTWFKEDDLEKSCIVIGEGTGIDGQNKIIACTQCGECIKVCPVQALTIDSNGIIRINKKTCVGCFVCVGSCPEFAMMVHKDYIEPFKCIACGQCVKVCPVNALKIEEKA